MFKPTAQMPQNLWREKPKDVKKDVKKKKSFLVVHEADGFSQASTFSYASTTSSMVSSVYVVSSKPKDKNSKKKTLLKSKEKNLKISESRMSTDIVLKVAAEKGENSKGLKLKKKPGLSIFEMCFPQRRALRRTKSH